MSEYLQTPKRRRCDGCPAFDAVGYVKGTGTKPADIIFLGGAPHANTEEAAYAPFSDRAGNFLKSVVTHFKSESKALSMLEPYYIHSVQCVVERPKVEIVEHCSTFVDQEMASTNAGVIVAMGATALQCLGIPGSIKSNRGVVHKHRFGGKIYQVICTYAPSAILIKDNQGLLNLFKKDINRAMHLCVDDTDSKITLKDLTKDYYAPKTVEDVKTVCETILDDCSKMSNNDLLLAVDTETTSLDMWAPDARCIAVSFSWDHRKAATILLDHKKAEYDYQDVLPYVSKVLGSDIPKVYHNYKFDYQVLELNMGLKVNNVKFDTMLAEHLLDENKKGYYSLKEIVGDYASDYKNYEELLWKDLKENPYEVEYGKIKGDLEEVRLKIKDLPTIADLKSTYGKDYSNSAEYAAHKTLKARRTELNKSMKVVSGLFKEFKVLSKDFTYEDVDVDKMMLYAGIDSDVTRQIALKQLPQMVKEKGLTKVMSTVCIPASRTLGRMSYEGFKVDLEYLEEVEQATDKEIIRLQSEVYKLSGMELNLNANREIINLLSTVRGLNLTVKTKKNLDYSVNEDTLKMLYRDTKDPVVDLLIKYRKAYNAKNKFLKGIRKMCAIDGKVHPSFNLNGTATGRLSCSSPNMQQLPKELGGFGIKKLFIPDDPENEVVFNGDYKAAEVRVLTAYTHDKGLIKATREGKCLHSFITSKVHNLPYEDIAGRDKFKESDPAKYKDYDTKRTAIKRAVFLIIYGGGALALQALLETEGVVMTLEECQGIMDLILKTYPSIKEYMDSVKTQIIKFKYVKSKFGRRRRFPLLNHDRRMFSSAIREGINMPIQSTSSDIVITRLMEVDNVIRALGGKMKITVHDSIVGTFPKNIIDKLQPILQKYAVDRVAELHTWLPVPFAMDAEYGPSYGEAEHTIM